MRGYTHDTSSPIPADDVQAADWTRIRRRSFLRLTAAGLGSVALGSLMNPQLLAAPRLGALAGCDPADALSRQGQTGDLADDGRRAVAPGNVRPQAEAGRDARQADAGEHDQGPADRAAAGRRSWSASARSSSSRSSASRAEICELFEQIGGGRRRDLLRPLDDHRAINHDPAHMFMNTGSQIAGRPSMGAWVVYGLGSESRGSARLRRADLAGPRRAEPADRRAAVVSGFLPSRFQGVQLRGRATRCCT